MGSEMCIRDRDRSQCYSSPQYPHACTPEMAWVVFRSTLAHTNYYLSLQEISFLAAVWNCNLRVYTYAANAASDSPLTMTHSTSFDGMLHLARVVLTFERRESKRGHFSRLFSDTSWEAYRGRVFDDDNTFPGSTSTSSSDERSSDNESSSDECSKLANNAQCENKPIWWYGVISCHHTAPYHHIATIITLFYLLNRI